MTGKELMDWIKENEMENAKVYVNTERGYTPVKRAWDSEKDGGAVMLELEKAER